jgi:hypothetical protein
MEFRSIDPNLTTKSETEQRFGWPIASRFTRVSDDNGLHASKRTGALSFFFLPSYFFRRPPLSLCSVKPRHTITMPLRSVALAVTAVLLAVTALAAADADVILSVDQHTDASGSVRDVLPGSIVWQTWQPSLTGQLAAIDVYMGSSQVSPAPRAGERGTWE